MTDHALLLSGVYNFTLMQEQYKCLSLLLLLRLLFAPSTHCATPTATMCVAPLPQ